MQETQSVSAELITVDPISQELQKNNITEQIIQELRDRYLPLRITSVDNKNEIKVVSEARKHCKNLRVMASKICKAGREDALKVQKAWVEKEKEITLQISEVEEHLERQEQWVNNERARIQEEQKKKELELIEKRLAEFQQYGLHPALDWLKSAPEEEYQKSLADAQQAWEKAQEQKRILEEKLAAERKVLEDARKELERQMQELEDTNKKLQEQLKKDKEELERLRNLANPKPPIDQIAPVSDARAEKLKQLEASLGLNEEPENTKPIQSADQLISQALRPEPEISINEPEIQPVIQEERKSYQDINTECWEGKMLSAAIIELTTTIHRNKTPDQVLELLEKIYQRF